MCQCNPSIRTPFCGVGKCQWPNQVTYIEDKKPHLTINCEDGVHVVPVSLLEDVASGQIELTEIENWKPIVKKVLAEWLPSVKQK